MSKYLQHRQILDCEYKEGFATEYIPFRTAQYAAVLTGFNLHQGLALIVADSGCNTSLVGKTFLDNYVPEAQYTTIPPLDVGGIVAKVTGEQWAIFSLLVPAQIGNRRVSCRVQVKALVISRLKAGLLLGTDNMMPERVIIDLDEKRLIFNGHKQAMTPLHPMQKPGTSVPHKVRAQQDVLLAPNKDYSISFWENSVRPKWMRSDCDYLFNPNHTHISLYVSVLDWDSRRVIARNSGPSSYLLKRGECLGTIVEMPPMKAMIADGNKESALEGGQEAIKAPPLNPGTDEEQQVLLNGITIAGSAGRRLRLAKVAEEFQQVWVNDGKLVEIPMRYWMTVPLKEGAQFPKHAKPYPYGPEASKTVDSTMDELQDSNKVSWSTGHTPSAFPLFVTYREVEKEGVLVKKPRVVVDIRKLNEITEPDVYPTQQQDDLLRRIAGKQFLSVFDAASFFYQWRVHPRHRNRMAVVSHRGQEVFNVAIMGFINSIAYVGRQMANILRGCEGFCAVYVDDIIVYSDTYNEHINHLRLIFNRLRGYQITLSPSKTFLGFNNVIVLGQKVTALGLSTTEEKMRSLRAWSFPKTHKEPEIYLGAVGHLRQFIPNYAQIAEPLEKYKTLLLKDSPSLGGPKRKNYSMKRGLSEATQAEKDAFLKLQSILSKGLFLYHQDPKRPLFINVDASKEYGFGAVVYHAREDWAGFRTGDYSVPPPRSKLLPILFLSRQLQGGEVRFHPTDMELACIVWVLRKIKVHVEVSPRTVFYTDHVSNTYIAHQSVQQASMGGYNMRLTLGAVLIRSFPRVEVRYIKGADNHIADALSRLPGSAEDDNIPSTTDPTGCAIEPPIGTAYIVTRSQRQRDKANVSKPHQSSSDDGSAAIQECSDHPGSALDEEEVHSDTEPAVPPLLRLMVPDNQKEARDQNHSVVTISDDVLKRIRNGYKSDRKWSAIITQLQEKQEALGSDMPNYPYKIGEDGLLWQHHPYRRLCLPNSMEQDIFALCHTPMHLGYRRSLERMTQFCIPRGASKLRSYIETCPRCLQTRTRRHRPHGVLQPILEPFVPFHTICIDIVLGLPDGVFNAFMSVTDKATKRCTFIPGRDTWDAESWGQALDMRLAEGDWGTPRKIISDRDPKFMAAIWKSMWEARQVKLAYTTAYHAQADGQSEMTNQIAEIALRNWLPYMSTPYQWHLILPHIQSVLNSSVHSTTKTSPHRVMYGLEIPSAFGPLTDKAQRETSHESERYDASIAVADAMMVMARHYDKVHLPLNLQPGDKVMLRLHRGYNIPSTKAFPKVSVQYAGPFQVIRRVSPLAVELKLPSTMRVHPVVSIAHLDPAPKSDPYNREGPPPQPVRMEDGSDDSWEIEALISRRDRVRRKKRIREYLVRWKGFGPEEDRWYSVENLQDAKELMAEYDAELAIRQPTTLAHYGAIGETAELDLTEQEELALGSSSPQGDIWAESVVEHLLQPL